MHGQDSHHHRHTGADAGLLEQLRHAAIVLVRHHGLNAIEATIGITAFSCVSFLPLYGFCAWLGVIPSHIGVAPASEMVFQVVFQGVGSVVISGITFNLIIRHYGPVRSTMIKLTL